MNKLWIAGLLLALAGCASGKHTSAPEPEHQEPAGNTEEPTEDTQEPADDRPALTGLDGKSVAFADALAHDRRTLLVIMTSWCVPCRKEQPKVEEFAETNGGTTRVFYVIAGSDVDKSNEIVTDRKFKLNAYADPEGKVSEYFDVEKTPTLLTFDADGKLTGTYHSIEDVPAGEQSAATKTLAPVADSGTELGTSYDVVVMATDEEKAATDLAAAREVCREAERHLSEWKDDSDISRLNREAGEHPVEVHGDLLKVISASLKVSKATAGAFDVTWYPLSGLWKQAAESDKLPSETELAEVMKSVGYEKVIIEDSMVSFSQPGTKLGLGAVAKGWIVDAVFLALKKRGYSNLIVNIGGDLRTAGVGPEGPWTFKITDPYRPPAPAGSFELQDGSVATSGNYIRYTEIEGKQYGHIIDPRTGRPAPFTGSVSVFAPDCAMADALATALFVMGPDEGLKWVAKTPGIKAIYVTEDGLKASFDIGG
ncbi:MAG: FAD:protein FMN transferase [Planctomycetes bacterium]|nr:FAD:protein FMN transferase [Planctomycetota bacterium]